MDGRVGLLIAPPIAYWITYRICLGLQQHDREVLDHGIETGIIMRLPHGEYIEVHQPLGEPDEHGHAALKYGGAAVPKKINKIGGAGRAIRGFFHPIETPPQLPQLGRGPDGNGASGAYDAEDTVDASDDVERSVTTRS